MSQASPDSGFPSFHLSAEEVVVLRRMTPEQKILAAQRLYYTAREIKEAALRAAHPDWTEEAIRRAVREAFLHAPD